MDVQTDAVARPVRQSGQAVARAEAIRLQRPSGRRIDSLDKLLRAYSYKDVLARGFALVTTADGELVRNPDQVRPGDPLIIELADDNKLGATVSGAPTVPRKRPKPPLEGGSQESLF